MFIVPRRKTFSGSVKSSYSPAEYSSPIVESRYSSRKYSPPNTFARFARLISSTIRTYGVEGSARAASTIRRNGPGRSSNPSVPPEPGIGRYPSKRSS